VMEQAFPWVIVLGIIGLAFWALARDNARLRRRSVEEFERDLARGSGAMLRGMAGDMEKLFTNEKRGAIEYVQDEERGMTKTGSKGDDKDRVKERSHGKEGEEQEIYDQRSGRAI